MDIPGPNPEQPPFDFETKDQTVQDLTLLVELADDFGGDLQVASGLVCYATTISEAKREEANWVKSLMEWRERGELRPELMAIADDEFAQFAQADAARVTQDNSNWAAQKLGEQLSELTEDAQVTRSLKLLGILGVEPAGDGFRVIERNEERVAAIIKVAKLMDTSYREFVKANPEYMAVRDPETVAEVVGIEMLDPRVQQILRKLRGEL